VLAETQKLEQIFDQVKQLSPEDRLRLIQKTIATLVSLPPQEPRPLRFGEFRGDEAAMSTLEDFAVAEWRPTDKELDGP